MGTDNEVIVIPGTKLRLFEEGMVAGSGTYKEGGYLRSSLVGRVRIVDSKIEVVPCCGGASLARAGDVVTAIVARVSARGARCELRCVRDRPLARPLRAQLDKENVYDANKDRVDMHKSFRPGDIILAKVVRSYVSACVTN
jgi:exosome complex component CSL4